MNRQLEFQLIPPSTWYINPRNIVGTYTWRKISSKIRELSGYKCAYCGIIGTNKNTDAHETYIFDDTKKTQTLDSIVCVCKKCHQSIHIGRATKEQFERAMRHYSSVNDISLEEAYKDYESAMSVWEERRKNQYSVVFKPDKINAMVGFDAVNINQVRKNYNIT